MTLEVIIVLQLAFNVVVIAALVMLRAKGGRRPGASRARKRRSGAPPREAAAPRVAADAPAREAKPSGLEDLVATANVRELAAERALRARLAQFRERVAQ